jgi:glycosyltransferase involved in cell wall biosynthesis
VTNDVDVSVIVPAYRADDTLPLCVDALLQQAFDGTFEVIVSASADSEAELPQLTSDPRLVVLMSVPKLPAGNARNRGASRARGRLLAFTDADCVADPHWLERLVAASRGTFAVAGAVVNGTPESVVGSAEYFVHLFEFHPSRPTHRTASRLGRAGAARHGATGSLLIPRGLWDKYGPFREDMSATQDTLLTLRMAEDGLLTIANDAAVAHLGRTALASVLTRQFRQGKNIARFGQQHKGAWWPWLQQPLLAPVVAGGRLLLLYARIVRRAPKELPMALACSPIVAAAFACWGVGLFAEGLSLLARRTLRRGVRAADNESFRRQTEDA